MALGTGITEIEVMGWARTTRVLAEMADPDYCCLSAIIAAVAALGLDREVRLELAKELARSTSVDVRIELATYAIDMATEGDPMSQTIGNLLHDDEVEEIREEAQRAIRFFEAFEELS